MKAVGDDQVRAIVPAHDQDGTQRLALADFRRYEVAVGGATQPVDLRGFHGLRPAIGRRRNIGKRCIANLLGFHYILFAEETGMHDPETTADRRERFLRLVAHLTEQLGEGKDPARLREQLVIAIMIAPVLAAESAVLLADFDAAVARVDKRT